MQRHLLIIGIVLLAVGMSGCKSIFKSRWSNFNAYYNTFYNAEQYYKTGIDLVENRSDPINPEQPIRIHKTPTNVGDAEFENAIIKSADVLRDYSESKWVDDALLLIGKSYYHQGKYFSADQKFQELLLATNSISLKHEGIKWRGLYFLNTEQYDEGIDYLISQLLDEELNWRRAEEAEVRLVLAQLYVEQELWELAEEQLKLGLEDARGKRILANGWFLLGQVQERLGKQDDAIDSFSRVSRFNPDYSMVYNARRKQAEISRETGQVDQALRIFSDMSRDDKNFDEMTEIYYEMARSYQLQGDYERAERLYFDVLDYEITVPTVETKAKTYFGLAEINRDYYKNYLLTAAYFDSASTSGRDETKLPSWFNAAEQSLSYNAYRQLSLEAYEADSLLWLSNLNQEAFDSVIAIVRLQKIEEMREARRRQEAAANTMINIGAGQQGQQGGANTSDNGFLNHKNPTMVSQAKEAFRAIWGDRPLVDNWRRLDAVRLAREDPSLTDDMNFEDTSSGTTEEEVTIDFSKIPFLPEDKVKSRELIASRIYEIGNVFFLQLDEPDSAEANYRSVINRFPDLAVSAQAMYSLSELYTIRGDSVTSLIWAERLASEHPETIYRNRVAERYPDRITSFEMAMSREDSLRVGFSERIRAIVDSVTVNNIESLRNYSAEMFDYPLAPDAMLLSAQKYIELGKEDSIYMTNYDRYLEINREWDRNEKIFAALKDSAKTILADSMSTSSDSLEWKPIADSTFKRKNFPELYPYYGAHWDSSRAVLSQWETQFQTNPKKDIVSRLSQSLAFPSFVVTYLDSINRKPDPVDSLLVPIDPDGRFIVDLDSFGKPIIPTDSLGRQLIATDSLGIPISPYIARDSLAVPIPDEIDVEAMSEDVNEEAAIDSTQTPPVVADSSLVRPPDTEVGVDTSLVPPPVTVEADTALVPPVIPPKVTGPIILPDGRRVYLCDEIEAELEVVENFEEFISSLDLKNTFRGSALTGVLKFRVRINEAGKPIQITVSDSATLDSVAQYIADAMQQRLSFKPIIGPDGDAVLAECEFSVVL